MLISLSFMELRGIDGISDVKTIHISVRVMNAQQLLPFGQFPIPCRSPSSLK